MRQILGATLLLLAAPAWPAPVRITGWVETSGASVGRIELQAHPREGQAARPPVAVQPAADGSFVVTAPEPGLYRLSVEAKGFPRPCWP